MKGNQASCASSNHDRPEGSDMVQRTAGDPVGQKYLRPDQAADYLGLSRSYLAKLPRRTEVAPRISNGAGASSTRAKSWIGGLRLEGGSRPATVRT